MHGERSAVHKHFAADTRSDTDASKRCQTPAALRNVVANAAAQCRCTARIHRASRSNNAPCQQRRRRQQWWWRWSGYECQHVGEDEEEDDDLDDGRQGVGQEAHEAVD